MIKYIKIEITKIFNFITKRRNINIMTKTWGSLYYFFYYYAKIF